MGTIPKISQINAENFNDTIALGLESSSGPKMIIIIDIKTQITPIKYTILEIVLAYFVIY
jgi:hypothetical protein